MSTLRDLDDARQFAARLAALEDADLRPEGQAIVLLEKALEKALADRTAFRKACDTVAARLCTAADQIECIRSYGGACKHCFLYDCATALIVPSGTEGSVV